MNSNFLRMTRRLFVSSTLSLLVALSGQARAQTQQQTAQAPDMQQMQKKLEQLEKEMAELKQQMAAAQQLSKQAVVGPSVPVETETRQAEENAEQAKPSGSINFYGFARESLTSCKAPNRVSLCNPLLGGFAYQRISYQQSVVSAPSENVTSAWISGQAKLYKFDRTNLVVTASLLPALSDPGRVHFNLNTSYYIKIWGKFNFNISFYGNWDTRPPAGFSGRDYGTSTGLNWTFGNR